MKILFLIHSIGKERHFESVVEMLAQRGHRVALGAVLKRKGLTTKQARRGSRIEVAATPDSRTDEWEKLARKLRVALDYVRYLDPRYARASSLVDRARRHAPDGLKRFVARYAWIRRHPRLLRRILELAEAAIPSPKYFELFVRSQKPDVVLLTPLVEFGSYQSDYIKGAHRLGLPVAFLPFSWDNLTNKGLMRAIPDRVLVWNEWQKREAMELHGVPEDRVIVTGAPRFDTFFDMRPSMDRESFCALVGLEASSPYILYLCSSKFAAPGEDAFVRRWVEQVRQSEDPLLRHAGVLVRPHPANRNWRGADVSGLKNVAVWQLRSTMNADQGLYDSIYHAAAVVGLNTSAMIEAGILGKPVHTLTVPEFAGGQEGTLHFEYFLTVNGGLVELARDFEQHRQQLAAALRDERGGRARSARFVEAFVRPHGLERPATPLMVRQIEKLAQIRKRPRHWAPLWHYPVRLALRIWRNRLV